MADSRDKLVNAVHPANGRNFLARLIEVFQSAQETLHQLLQIIKIIFSPVVVFFSFIGVVVRRSHAALWNCLAFARAMVHFDYRTSAEAALDTPKTFYRKLRTEARKRLWNPVEKWLRFLTRRFWMNIRELRVYCRGLAELSRRLFLLTSDYMPGGKLTVGIFLGIISYMLVTTILTYAGTALGLLNLLFNMALFILDPIVLTLKDLLSVVRYLLGIILAIFYRIFSLVCFAVEKVLYFFGINVAAISTGVYNCWRVFVTSKPVQLICTLVISALYSSFDFTLFSILPFLSKVTVYVSTAALRASAFAYSKLAVVNTENYSGEWSSVTSIAYSVLTLYTLWITFRLRNAFPPALHAVVEGYESIKAPKPGRAAVATRKTDRPGDKVKTTGDHNNTQGNCDVTCARAVLKFFLSMIFSGSSCSGRNQ